MPAKEHAQLAARADELGLKGERRDAYIYGTLDKIKKARAAKRQRRRRATRKKKASYTLE